MARFRLLTPDAQYADDGVIERRTAGADVDWDIFRERLPERLPTERARRLRCDGGLARDEGRPARCSRR